MLSFCLHSAVEENNETTSMEIENIQSWERNSKKVGMASTKRMKDMKNDSCFKCHEVGCRSSKCEETEVCNLKLGMSENEIATLRPIFRNLTRERSNLF